MPSGLAFAPTHLVEMLEIETINEVPVFIVVPQHCNDSCGVEQEDKPSSHYQDDLNGRYGYEGPDAEKREQKRAPKSEDKYHKPRSVARMHSGNACFQVAVDSWIYADRFHWFSSLMKCVKLGQFA
jgi:hypothetical protein